MPGTGSTNFELVLVGFVPLVADGSSFPQGPASVEQRSKQQAMLLTAALIFGFQIEY